MKKDLIRGKTLRFTFENGAMAGKAFDHDFDEEGTVAFHAAGSGQKPGASSDAAARTKYEVATIRDDVWAVSYLSSAGYALTAILDFATKRLVAFSSNEKMLSVQKGTFEEIAGAPKKAKGHEGATASARH